MKIPQGRHAPAAQYKREARSQLNKVMAAMEAALADTRRIMVRCVRKAAATAETAAIVDIETSQAVVEALAKNVRRCMDTALKAICPEEDAQ